MVVKEFRSRLISNVTWIHFKNKWHELCYQRSLLWCTLNCQLESNWFMPISFVLNSSLKCLSDVMDQPLHLILERAYGSLIKVFKAGVVVLFDLLQAVAFFFSQTGCRRYMEVKSWETVKIWKTVVTLVECVVCLKYCYLWEIF